MKKATLKLMLTLTCITALTALAWAATQSSLMKAKIPFGFHIGNKALPAGTYVVSRSSSSNIVIFRNLEQNNKNAVVITNTDDSRKVNENAMLEFRRYGDQYFLRRVMPVGGGSNLQLPISRSERDVATGAKNLANQPVNHEIVTITGQ